METTLDIAEDVLEAAKELGRREKKSTGEVISELARRALSGRSPAEETDFARAVAALPSLPLRGGGVVTSEIVNALRDREE